MEHFLIPALNALYIITSSISAFFVIFIFIVIFIVLMFGPEGVLPKALSKYQEKRFKRKLRILINKRF